MKRVTDSRDALRVLARIPANMARLIHAKIDQYAADPTSLGNNVKRLKGEPGYYRLRVGDWRALFREDGVVLL